MSPSIVNALLVVVMLLNLAALGAGRVHTVIRAVALQGGVLGLLALFVREEFDVELLLVAVLTAAFKGVVIPSILRRAMREVDIGRETAPIVGLAPSMLLGAVATAAAVAFAGSLPLLPRHQGSLIAPAALSTVLVGFVLLITRTKAISQAQGYLVLENGVYVFGLLLLDTTPFLVEIGVLLDLVGGIFVLGIILTHIKAEFASLDTRRLASLKE